MATSKIIKDIVEEIISVENALTRLLVILDKLENEEIKEWIFSELNGYSDSKKLPDYRMRIAFRITYSGISGRCKVKNVTLPINALSKEYQEFIYELAEIREGINTLMNTRINEGPYGKDLTDLAGDVYKNTGIMCTNIFMEFTSNNIDHILSNVKTRLLSILLELERQFGNLDNLDINISQKNDEELKVINDDLRCIIYSDDKEDIL